MPEDHPIILFTRLAIKKFFFKSQNVAPGSLAPTPGMAVSLFDSCLITFLVWQERWKIKRKRSEI